MKRIGAILFRGAAVVSLLVLIGTVALWMASYRSEYASTERSNGVVNRSGSRVARFIFASNGRETITMHRGMRPRSGDWGKRPRRMTSTRKLLVIRPVSAG